MLLISPLERMMASMRFPAPPKMLAPVVMRSSLPSSMDSQAMRLSP